MLSPRTSWTCAASASALVALLAALRAEAKGDEKPRKTPNEMLLPRHSTTVLMCEPVFSSGGEALWYKDGLPLGVVTSESNLVFDNRTLVSEESVPEVGFLIISNITTGKSLFLPLKSSEDQGYFWCRSSTTGDAGEVFHLLVAYLDVLPPQGHIVFEPRTPSLEAPLLIRCPLPEARPSPSVSWFLNGAPLEFSTSQARSLTNGSLLLPRLSMDLLGLYECVVSNFAGRSSTRSRLDSHALVADPQPEVLEEHWFSPRSSTFFRSSGLWFLLGSLFTSCGVLFYLVVALLCLRSSRARLTLRPWMFLHWQEGMAPGFGKVVPVPDVAPLTQP